MENCKTSEPVRVECGDCGGTGCSILVDEERCATMAPQPAPCKLATCPQNDRDCPACSGTGYRAVMVRYETGELNHDHEHNAAAREGTPVTAIIPLHEVLNRPEIIETRRATLEWEVDG